MKLRVCFFSVVIMLLSGSTAFAWNCSDPLASRVDVGTTQPSGSSGDGDNQWFKGTGSEGLAGHYYICETPKTTPPPTDLGSNSNTNSNSNNNSNSNSNKNKNSNKNNNNANGGAGGQGGSVSGSGNSTNTNTANGGNATANGGNANQSQGQKQGQSQSSSNTNTSTSAASNNGNGSNNASYSSETNIAAPKIPVATAYAPTTLPTSPCTKGFGGGVQTMPVGGTFGMSSVDKNCVILEAARNAPNILTFCKIYITHKAVKAAHVTLDDCMKSYDIPEPVVKEIIKEVPVPVEVIKEVPVVKEVPAPVLPFQNQLVGICTFASQFSCDLKTKTPGNPLRVTTICDDMLRQAITLQQNNPGTVIKLIGNANASERLSSSMYSQARAKNVQRRLVVLGASPTTITVETGKTRDRTVEVWVVVK
jgi:hypothetical protein